MTDKAVEGAKEFLLLEYQSIYTLHQEAKAVGETRLNFYVTFAAAVLTATITIQSFILPELRIWIITSIAFILISVGLITYRKMLQRRAVIVIYRRRLARIRAWFVKYYPPVSTGLPYDTNQNIKMDWGSKSKLGSTASSVAVINTALIILAILTIGITAFGTIAAIWAAPIALLGGFISWGCHILWKINYMKRAESSDEKDLHALDKVIRSQTPTNQKQD
jgi:hypothetical protein